MLFFAGPARVYQPYRKTLCKTLTVVQCSDTIADPLLLGGVKRRIAVLTRLESFHGHYPSGAGYAIEILTTRYVTCVAELE